MTPRIHLEQPWPARVAPISSETCCSTSGLQNLSSDSEPLISKTITAFNILRKTNTSGKYAQNNKEIIKEIIKEIDQVTMIKSAIVIRLDISDFTQAKDNLQ